METIRYYERIGLLPSPARTGGNYRSYGRAHLARLSFVRRSRDLGFSLEAVRELLRLSDRKDQPCDGCGANSRHGRKRSLLRRAGIQASSTAFQAAGAVPP